MNARSTADRRVEPREPREKAYVAPRLIWTGRLAWLVAPTGIALVVLCLRSGVVEHDGNRVYNLGLVGVVGSIFAGVFAIKLCNRRIESARDAWRHARRAERHPELVEQEGRITAPHPVAAAADASAGLVQRTTFDGTRLRRRPEGRARIHSLLEWFFIAFLVLGMPTLIHFLGPPQGLFSFVAIGFTLLAITNRVDTWASEKVWTPGNAQAEARKRERIENGGRWWAAEPPKLLRYVRGIYLVFVVAGFFYCLVWPFLRGQSPEERYPYAAVYVAGFLIGLAVLASFERHQRRLERHWLLERQEQRARE